MENRFKVILRTSIIGIIANVALGIVKAIVGLAANSIAITMDAVISAATVFAALLFIFTGISVEAWLAVLISIIIIKSGIETLMDTVSKLLGDGADVELVKSIKKTIVSNKGVKGAYDLVLNNYGPDSYYASVHIEVEDTISANEFDQLSRKIEEAVYEEHNIILTAVGLYSINTRDKEIVQM